MLEELFEDAATRRRLVDHPLGPYVESYAATRATLGYARSTVRGHLWPLADLGRWLGRNAIAVEALNEEIVKRHLEERRGRGRGGPNTRTALAHLLEHLRDQQVIAPVDAAVARSAIVRRYEAYLRAERGLTTATVINYCPFIERLLRERFGDGGLAVDQLTSVDLSRFVLRHAHTMSPGRAKLMVTALRSFVRFLLQHGEIDTDLAACVPTVADWRLATVPKHLAPEEVERLLSTCDQRTPKGRRDYAVLLLLARLGLRAGEVVALELDDLDWRAGELTVRGKGLRRERLPLLAEVGEAVAGYLRHDRPACASRRLFLRMRAPRRGFASPAAVTTIVERAVAQAGLHPPFRGAHLLRHSLATGLLRGGASLIEIGQILRHRSAQSTEIYAKVDLGGLRSLARPWPAAGGGDHE
jgi:site-specific recombinase XerD